MTVYKYCLSGVREKYLAILCLIASITTLVSSCNFEEPRIATVADLSPEAKSFLLLRTGASVILSISRNATIEASSQKSENSAGGRIGKTTSTHRVSCLPDPDAFIYAVSGGMTQTFSYERQEGSNFGNGFKVNSAFDSYGGQYFADSLGNHGHTWSMVGSSIYSGLTIFDFDSFTGTCQYKEETTYHCDDRIYRYSSNGEVSYDEEKWTFTLNNYRYNKDDNYYEAMVLKPLVSKVSCTDQSSVLSIGITTTFVSGREKITYNQAGQSGSFIIDYGDGSCDTRITIIENGQSILIDLSTDWVELSLGG